MSGTFAAQRPEKNTQPRKEDSAGKTAVLWRDPGDVSSKNLLYGEGGKEDAPPGTTFTYVKEDLNGTNPKFNVVDENGVKWRIKLGEEARPETVATRFLWAAGYFTDEEYFLPKIQVNGMRPLSRKMRGRVKKGMIDADGVMLNAELKRSLETEKKIGSWRWRRNPFVGTRELNGLRVMMALLNNWDLKDENNAIFAEKKAQGENEEQAQADHSELVYAASDVGASFGTSGLVFNRARSKGNLDSYTRSKFIRKIAVSQVDFDVPAREPLLFVFNGRSFFRRLRLRSLGRQIPRSDAKWLGGVLARLSPDQVRDAFRSAGYGPEQAEAFANVVEERIAELNRL